MTVLRALGLGERIGKDSIPQPSHCPAARALGHITSLLKYLQPHRCPYPCPQALRSNSLPGGLPLLQPARPPHPSLLHPLPWTLTHAAALLSQVFSYLSAFAPLYACHALLVFICFVLPYPCYETLLRYHFLPAFSRPFPSADRGSILIPLRSPSPSKAPGPQ